MKMGQESNSQQPDPNIMPVPKSVVATMVRPGGVVELCGAVTPSGWHSAGSGLDGIGRMKSRTNRC